MNYLRFSFIGILFLLQCREPELPTCTTDSGPLFAHFSFPVGAALEPLDMASNSAYASLANTEFNSITPENIFKPAFLHPEPGVFYWQETDSLVQFCLNAGKRLHGHTLIWHQQLPYWMENFQGNATEWESMMKNHIQTIVGRYKGKVRSWDVVNEALEDDGSLRNNTWLEHIGESYIEKAFQFAQEADPDALLFYNDYSLESKPEKCKAALDMLQKLRDKGVKIDGIGLQMHISILSPSNNSIENAVQAFATAGFLVHLSELDISINPLGNKITSPKPQALLQQADKMRAILQIYQNIPAAQQFGITFWGIGDSDSWIPGFFGRTDFPLLFDENYAPKPIYCTMIE